MNLHKDTRALAAVETVIVLPLQIMVMCAIVQMAHFFVTYQTVQFAAFAAARTALAANMTDIEYQDAVLDGDNKWSGIKSHLASGSVWDQPNYENERKIVSAAVHACSLLELFRGENSLYRWVDMPAGGKFREDNYSDWETQFLEVENLYWPDGPDGGIIMSVSYNALLPVPFASRIFEASMEGFDPNDLMSFGAASDGRAWFRQTCAISKPWH